MRPFVSLCLLCLAACASRTTGGSTARTETVRVATTGTTVAIQSTSTTAPSTREVARAADALWAVLPAVYDSLGIPVAQRQPATRTLGNDGLRLRRRLGSVPLQRYLDCGRGQDGPNAESYEVHLSVQTQVKPGARQTSHLSTIVQAQARPVNFSGEWVRCASRDMLEERIAELALQLAQ